MIPWLALNIERLALTSALGICLTVSPVVAETLSGQLPSLLSKHERIIAAKEDMIASKHALQEAVGAWLPTLDATLNLGTEVQIKPGSDDTDAGLHNVEFAATQLIYDFGSTGSSIDTAKLTLRQSELFLESRSCIRSGSSLCELAYYSPDSQACQAVRKQYQEANGNGTVSG